MSVSAESRAGASVLEMPRGTRFWTPVKLVLAALSTQS